MGKKKKEILDKEYIPFSDGMRANGYSDAAIKTLWDILLPFSDYAFNKAHTAGYGLVSYWTAYLKANYPAEYMAALLTWVRDDKDKSAVYLDECRRMGIKVLPPYVNSSDADFTPAGTDIRFGLSAIRNVGANVVDVDGGGPHGKGRFADFADFLRKVEPVVCNKQHHRVIGKIIASTAACSSVKNEQSSASSSQRILPRMVPRASWASARGSRCPAASAFSMSRPETP